VLRSVAIRRSCAHSVPGSCPESSLVSAITPSPITSSRVVPGIIEKPLCPQTLAPNCACIHIMCCWPLEKRLKRTPAHSRPLLTAVRIGRSPAPETHLPLQRLTFEAITQHLLVAIAHKPATTVCAFLAALHTDAYMRFRSMRLYCIFQWDYCRTVLPASPVVCHTM